MHNSLVAGTALSTPVSPRHIWTFTEIPSWWGLCLSRCLHTGLTENPERQSGLSSSPILVGKSPIIEWMVQALMNSQGRPGALGKEEVAAQAPSEAHTVSSVRGLGLAWQPSPVCVCLSP